jgi:hypothetical protein
MASIRRKSPLIEASFIVNLGSLLELVKDAGVRGRSPQKLEKVGQGIKVYINLSLPVRVVEVEERKSKKEENPGIAELMEAYGRYEEFLHQVREYFNAMKPKFALSVADSSAPG